MKMKKAYAAAFAAAMVLTAGFSVQAVDLRGENFVNAGCIVSKAEVEAEKLTSHGDASVAKELSAGSITTGSLTVDGLNIADAYNDHESQLAGVRTEISEEHRVNSEQQTKIDNMQSDMDAYRGQIDTLNGQYSTEYAERVAADADLQSQLDEHKSWIDQANGDISGAIAVNGEQQTQIDDMQSQLDEHKSWIDQANGDISGAIAVNKEQQDQINAIDNQINGENGLADAVADAEAKADGALKVQGNGVLYNHGTDLTTGINLNTSAIEQEVKDRENADKQLSNAITNNSHRIDSLSGRVDDLGGEIDNVGAISAALAGLHPLDYDGTGSKFQLAAAMGSYDGSQAAAIGGFYHFNEDVMMSVGTRALSM